MKPDFWIGRWERGETGWHQTEVEPGLVTHFPKIAPTRVLVPLCGKSLDLKWLADQGHEVIGVELSEFAVRAFFADHGLTTTETQDGPYRAFCSGRITLLQGDFFDLDARLLGRIGAIYDRAALIALPPELRARYATHLQSLIRQCGEKDFVQLQIVLERTPTDPVGPPFSIPGPEIESLYATQMTIQPVSRELLETREDGTQVQECIYLLRPKGNS